MRVLAVIGQPVDIDRTADLITDVALPPTHLETRDQSCSYDPGLVK
jgi:hypothetical protein